MPGYVTFGLFVFIIVRSHVLLLYRLIASLLPFLLNMDVDLLRPGTVPMSRDTMLWFEFLLNPDLLEQHLNNPNGGAYYIMLI